MVIIYSYSVYIFFPVLKLKALYANFLFINRSSVNSSALGWGHRNRGDDWQIAGVCRSPSAARLCKRLRQDGKQNCRRHSRLNYLPCFTAAVFLGAVPPTGFIIETKDWESLFRLHSLLFTQLISQWTPFTLRMFTLKKWQMFWKHLIKIKQTEKDFVCAPCWDVRPCFLFFFSVYLSTTLFMFPLSASLFVLTS